LGFGIQIPKLPAQRKCVSAGNHAHKPPKNFLSQSIGIDENITFQLKFLF